MPDKLPKLRRVLESMSSVLLAYSGGVDSTFLLKAAIDVLGKEKVIAVTADSATYPRKEFVFARRMAVSLGARHVVIRTDEFKNPGFCDNTLQRCYFCKKELFGRLKALSVKYRCSCVIDASNADDKKDFRPGSRAKVELGVRSPLQESGFTKVDIRRSSRKLGLPTWDKPSLACLASRVPYGQPITLAKLKRIEQAEGFIRGLGFKNVRVRDYAELARVEVDIKSIKQLLTKSSLVVDKLKSLSYNYITVDLEGFRSGSMNEALKKGKR